MTSRAVTLTRSACSMMWPKAKRSVRSRPREELKGVSVVVNGGAGLKAVFLHDDFGAGPLEKGFLDQEAGRVFADFAEALVAGEILFLGFEDFSSAFGDGGLLSAG